MKNIGLPLTQVPCELPPASKPTDASEALDGQHAISNTGTFVPLTKLRKIVERQYLDIVLFRIHPFGGPNRV